MADGPTKQEDASSKQAEIDANNSVNELDQKIKTQEGKVSAASTKVSDINKKLVELKAEEASLAKDLRAKTSSVEEATAKLTEAQNAYNSLSSEESANYTEARTNLDNAKRALETANLDLNTTLTQYSEKQKEVKAKTEEKSSAESVLTTEQATMESLKNQKAEAIKLQNVAAESVENLVTLDSISTKLTSLPGISKLNLDKTNDFSKLSADGSGGSDKIDEMVASSSNSESKDVYYGKDISASKDASEIVTVKIPKEKEAEVKPELEQEGFTRVDSESELAGKFKTKDLTAKESKTPEDNVSNRATDENSEGSSEGASSGSTTNQDSIKPELGYDEKKKKLENEGIKEYKKNEKLIIAGHEVPYVKVNGSNKIRFPKYDKVMGLPPMVITKTDTNNTTDIFNVNIIDDDGLGLNEAKEYFLYNIDDMLENSFPILTIRPLDCENLMGTNGKLTKDKTTHDKMKREKRYNIVDGVIYKFAVTTQNSISYNHQNNFAQSSTESSGLVSSLNGMGKFTSDLVGTAQNSAGFGYNNMIGDLTGMGLNLGGDVDEAVRQFIKSGNSAAGSLGEIGSKMGKTVADVANLVTSVVGGGRIDFPDVWQDSQTNFQTTFTIELRSLNPDPSSEQYFHDIILPLYILLTISLPTEGNVFSYKTPPLITCSLDDSFMEILLGAVTQISWTFDTKEINFKKVPWHCQVNITIRDLYSVMSQATYTTKNEQYVKESNREIMTKEKYFQNFIKTKDKKVPNEKYYLTEFAKIPAYLAALEKMQADEAKAAEDAKKDSTANGSGAVTKGDTGKVNHDGTKSGAETGTAEKAAEIKTDPKTGKKSLVQSIGGFVTGITKNIKNVVADVKKAIQPVRQLINTGKTVLQTAYNLKTSIKMVGETANLTGILNGSFAASTRLAFDNLGKAGNVLSKLSGGALGPAMKSVGTICNTLSDIGRSALTLDLPSCVGKDGKTVSLKDQINVASSTVGATLGMVRNIANTVQAAKQIGAITKSSDPLATLNTYLGAANSIIDDIDFTDRLLNATKGSAIATGQYTAGQLSSDASLQAKFEYVAQRVAENARLVNSTMFNTTFMEYMVQQDWFDKYFTLLRTPTETYPVSIADFAYKTEKGKAITVKGVSDSGLSVSEATGLSQEELTKSMGHIDSALNKFADGVGKEFSANSIDIVSQSASSGLANVADVPVTVVITSNLPNSNPTAGGTVTIG